MVVQRNPIKTNWKAAEEFHRDIKEHFLVYDLLLIDVFVFFQQHLLQSKYIGEHLTSKHHIAHHEVLSHVC